MEKSISILGSTGSVGVQTLNVARNHKDFIRVVGLAARKNIDLLEMQAIEFQPEIICVFEEKAARELKRRRPSWNIVSGVGGLCEVASHPNINMAVMAMVGSDGILPVVEGIRAKKSIALANKEILVAAGDFITRVAKENGVTIYPIDSEHSAIFQCMTGEKIEDVKRIILTASGGPFLYYGEDQLKKVTAVDAANHPTWTMGSKVSIDCSTLMNKGFEVIEARWLFDIPPEKIDVIIHPQSIIHSMVEFIDGSIKAQMGWPNMELPIQYALTHPGRRVRNFRHFGFEFGKLEFFQPDLKKFRCLELAYTALKAGGTLPCVLNAANEVLVERFCQGGLSWIHIPEKLEEIISRHKVSYTLSVDTILEVDRETRLEALTI